MAKAAPGALQQAQHIISQVRGGQFSQIYLLMGDEPFYPDMVCDEIVAHAIPVEEKDFNEVICYGQDVDAEAVISAARRFPMMADRQLIVVKDAQLMEHFDDLSLYCSKPLDTTILVLLLRHSTIDKRKSLYKTIQNSEKALVLESPLIREGDLQRWISDYYRSRGLQIEPVGAALLAECVGADLENIVSQTEKMLKNLPEGTVKISAEDVEKNIGISRQYSVFELTKTLSYRDAEKSLKIAYNYGNMAKFAMPQAVSGLFVHFYRILKIEAGLNSYPSEPFVSLAKAVGVNPYFAGEYEAAVKNYPLHKCMSIISLLSEYDFKGKGGEVGSDTAPGELLLELVTKILNI